MNKFQYFIILKVTFCWINKILKYLPKILKCLPKILQKSLYKLNTIYTNLFIDEININMLKFLKKVLPQPQKKQIKQIKYISDFIQANGYYIIFYGEQDCSNLKTHISQMKEKAKDNKIANFASWECKRHDSHSYIIPDSLFWKGQLSNKSNVESKVSFNHKPQSFQYKPGHTLKFQDGSTITFNSVDVKQNQMVKVQSGVSINGSNLHQFPHLITDSKEKLVSLAMKKIKLTNYKNQYVNYKARITIPIPKKMRNGPYMNKDLAKYFEFKHLLDGWEEIQDRLTITDNQFSFQTSFDKNDVHDGLLKMFSVIKQQKEKTIQNKDVYQKQKETLIYTLSLKQHDLSRQQYKQNLKQNDSPQILCNLQKLLESYKIDKGDYTCPEILVNVQIIKDQINQNINQELFTEIFKLQKPKELYKIEVNIDYNKKELQKRLNRIKQRLNEQYQQKIQVQQIINNIYNKKEYLSKIISQIRYFFNEEKQKYEKIQFSFLQNQQLKKTRKLFNQHNQEIKTLIGQMQGLKKYMVQSANSYVPQQEQPPQSGTPIQQLKRQLGESLKNMPEQIQQGDFQKLQEYTRQLINNDINTAIQSRNNGSALNLMLNDLYGLFDQNKQLQLSSNDFDNQFNLFIAEVQRKDQQNTTQRQIQLAKKLSLHKSKITKMQKKLKRQRDFQINIEKARKAEYEKNNSLIAKYESNIQKIIQMKTIKIQEIINQKLTLENSLLAKKQKLLKQLPSIYHVQVEQWFQKNQNSISLNMINEDNNLHNLLLLKLKEINGIGFKIDYSLSYKDTKTIIQGRYLKVLNEVTKILNQSIKKAQSLTNQQTHTKVNNFLDQWKDKFLEVHRLINKMKNKIKMQKIRAQSYKYDQLKVVSDKLTTKFSDDIEIKSQQIFKNLSVVNFGNMNSKQNENYITNIQKEITLQNLEILNNKITKTFQFIEQMATLINKIRTQTYNRISAFRNRFGNYGVGADVNNHNIINSCPQGWVSNDINNIKIIIEEKINEFQKKLIKVLQRIDIIDGSLNMFKFSTDAFDKIKSYFNKFEQLQSMYMSKNCNVDIYARNLREFQTKIQQTIESIKNDKFNLNINHEHLFDLSIEREHQFQQRILKFKLPQLKLDLDRTIQVQSLDIWVGKQQEIFDNACQRINDDYERKMQQINRHFDYGLKDVQGWFVVCPKELRQRYKQRLNQPVSIDKPIHIQSTIPYKAQMCSSFYTKRLFEGIQEKKSLVEIQLDIKQDQNIKFHDHAIGITTPLIHPKLQKLMLQLKQELTKFRLANKSNIKKKLNIKENVQNIFFNENNALISKQEERLIQKAEQINANIWYQQKMNNLNQQIQSQRATLMNMYNSCKQYLSNQEVKLNQIQQILNRKKMHAEKYYTQMKKILQKKKFYKTRAEKRSAKASQYYQKMGKFYCAIDIPQTQFSTIDFINKIESLKNKIIREADKIYKEESERKNNN